MSLVFVQGVRSAVMVAISGSWNLRRSSTSARYVRLRIFSRRSKTSGVKRARGTDVQSQIFLANQFTYFVLCPVLRISIICFYRRLFSTRQFKIVTTGLIWLISLWGVGIFLACALQCRPLRGFWDKSVEATCFDGNLFFIVNQAFNVVMDFVLLALPLPIIWRLHRSWREKLGLSGVFLIGGL